MTKTVKTESSVFINGEFNHNIKCCYYINSQKKVYLRRNTYNEKIGIMTDSHSGILTEEAEKLGIKVLPMPFYIDDKLYLEGVDLSREEFYEKLRQELMYLPHSHLHRK